MKLPFTQKNVQDWGGITTYRDGRALAVRGCVQEAEWDLETRTMRGVVAWGSHSIRTSGRVLEDGSLENQCPCRDCRDRGVVCTHIVALAYALIVRYTDPERERKLLEEERQARHLKLVEEKAFLKRVALGTEGAQDCRLRLVLPDGWTRDAPRGSVPLEVHIEFAFGAIRRLDGIPRDMVLGMSPQDDSILFVLEEIAGGRVPGRMHLSPPDFLNILGLHRGHPIHDSTGKALPVQTQKVLTSMYVDLDHKTGELILRVHTPTPEEAGASQEASAYWVAGSRGFIFNAGAFWPLEKVLPEPLHAIYREPVIIARPDVPRFLKEELPPLRQWLEVITEIEPDVFDIEPEVPQFRMLARGGAASLSIQLMAVYGDVSFPCGVQCAAGSFAHPDPEDILHYTVRNPIAERFALDALERHGIFGRNGAELSPVVGIREVLNFLGETVPALRRRGWKVEWVGRIKTDINRMNYATPVVRIEGQVGSWFDVTVSHEDAKGRAIPPGEIHRALLKGDSFVEWNGRTILLDAGAIRSLSSVFSDCAAGEGNRPGSFRLASVHAAYVAGALSALDGVDIEAPPEWLRRAAEQNRLTPSDPTPFDPSVDSVLRPYQKTGVRWLRFLEKNHFAGILADEMGLGKTLETLVWLAELVERNQKEGKARPALIICPTSLVENWIAESNKFTPNLRIGAMSGADRHSRWSELDELDIVVTSYALLRRDIEQYAALEFSAAVLDEAQNIKNFSSQNALAAKRLRAEHRLVLTGTPIENGVFDVWSIMDFLMPGYLGTQASFKTHIAQPIAQGGPEGEMAQWKLRRKLRPFLLRRMKKDVAKELPPKIERIAGCALSDEQKKVYKDLLADSRRRIGEMVASKGFNHSRFEILRTLMRLRQACCHLDLLPAVPGATPFTEPSSKMELFFELLDEAHDAGHRVLVFSQFTSMLAIIRAEMDRRATRYCYLDGAT